MVGRIHVIDDHIIEIVVQLEPVRLGSGLPMMKIKTSLKGKITTLVMLKQLNGVLDIDGGTKEMNR